MVFPNSGIKQYSLSPLVLNFVLEALAVAEKELKKKMSHKVVKGEKTCAHMQMTSLFDGRILRNLQEFTRKNSQ